MFDYLPEIYNSPETKQIETIGDLAGMVINVLFGVVLAVSVITLVYGGIQYATSSGDPKAAGTARSTIFFSVIAMVLAVGALTFRNVILNILGVTDPNFINAKPNF